MIPSLFQGSVSPSACSSSAIPFPALDGAHFLSIDTLLVTNHTSNVHSGLYTNHGAVKVDNVSFCNVTLSYTHTGEDDTVNVQVWLPIDTWNGRLQAIGGAGWQAGLHYAGQMGMAASVAEGYATVSTDAGLGSETTPENWGLIEEGRPNLNLLRNLASVSLNDAAVIAKSVTESFYGEPPRYSYFSGCSQGGRQGLMLAQRYPDAFDGIAASAPAINWNSMVIQGLYPLFVMDLIGEYPPSCEIDALTAAAVEACDGDDGIEDGIISDGRACTFDPMSMVGKTIDCDNFNATRQISEAAAKVVQAAWSGAKRANGSSIWFGPYKDSVLTGSATDVPLIPTTCSNNGTCTRGTLSLFDDWIRLFVLKNSSATVAGVTQEEFDSIFDASVAQYSAIIDTNDPDLSAFRNRGGKMISYHGMADSIIPARGSEHYYERVMAMDPDVQSYYRLFLAPGLNHCFGGPGPYPDTTFDALREWVEEGVAPKTLQAKSVGTDPIIERPLCPYPSKQVHQKGGLGAAGGFSCQGSEVDFEDLL
ncbi:hypothetical protein ACJ41O_005660 [Fusarium nematophilum]